MGLKGFRGIENLEKDCPRRNGKREEGSRQKKISDDNIKLNALYVDTERKAVKRVEWRILCFQ